MTPATYPVVCYGEVLWDILPTGATPGGAPMNVAYHLKKLGVNPALITKIGNDDWGSRLQQIISDAGLTTDYVLTDEDETTGLVFAQPNEHNEVVYDIVFPSAWDFIEWQSVFSTLVSASKFFVFGSLTSRNKVSRDTLYQLLEAANTRVLDINLRPPNYHRSDVETLLQKADILKVNLAELELITGWFSKFESLTDRLQLLQDRFHLPTVIVTMGGDGAIVNHLGNAYQHDGIKVKVADTIGSGDAFLAGFLSKILQGKTAEEALQFASAIGAFVATKSGACPDYNPAAIDSFMSHPASSHG